MSSDRRFEQELPGLLDDLYMGPTPTYRANILQQTARTCQRPAWSFLERWLPMVDIARQPVLAPPLPWRRIGLALALIALLVALIAAAIVVGSRPKLPQPFGPARNGLVAYASGGDIYTVDPVTGNSTAVVRGPETDINPRWSRDGTRLAFERTTNGDSGPGLVFVAGADGSSLTRITPDPLDVIWDYSFSPNGKQILISANISGVTRLLIADTDGSQIRQPDIGTATEPAWRPDGSEVLFNDGGDTWDGHAAMYGISTEGGVVRTILDRAMDRYRGAARWSPDGSLISYNEWVDSNDLTAQIHIKATDGAGDRILPILPGAVWQASFAWSNDGTRLLAIRGYTGGFEATRAVAIPVDGSGFGIEINYPGPIQTGCCSVFEWAPDDSSVLGTPTDASGAYLDQVLIDPVAGTSRPLPWKSVSLPTWQRLSR